MTIMEMDTDMEPLLFHELVAETGLDPFGPWPIDTSAPEPWFPRSPSSVMAHIADLVGTTATTWTRENAAMVNFMLAEELRREEEQAAPIQAEIISVGAPVATAPWDGPTIIGDVPGEEEAATDTGWGARTYAQLRDLTLDPETGTGTAVVERARE